MSAGDGPHASGAEDVAVWFSFRSPYSWMALHRLSRLLAPSSRHPGASTLAGVDVRLSWRPVFPAPGTVMDPSVDERRFRYTLGDFLRVATAYGLPVAPPASLDTDWIRPSAAFVAADDAGAGLPFALGIFAARFQQQRDPAEDAVIADSAAAAGLDPARIVGAAADAATRQRVEALRAGAAEAGVVGVPFFVWRGQRFWGNDRLDWLLRALREANGLPVPDLARDPLAAPV